MPFNYNAWVDDQSRGVREALDEIGRTQGYRRDVALYVIPSAGSISGRLVPSDKPVPNSCDVIRFPAQGSAVMAVPRSHLRALLWDACRHVPICPTIES